MSELPPEISVIESPDGEVRYCLPKRPANAIRRIACGVMLVFGGFFAAIPIVGILFFSSTQKPCHQNGFLQPDVLLPLLVFGPICFPLGGLILFWGLHIVAGHTEITIRSGRLRVLFKCGPVGLPRRMRLDKIRVFRLTDDVETPQTNAEAIVQPVRSTSLMAELSNGKSKAVCVGYPGDWLMPLAKDLARRCQEFVEHEVNAPVEPIKVEDDPAKIQDRPQQPSRSTAILEPRPNGLTITIPPPGMLKGSSRSFVSWCLCWNGLVFLMTPLFLYSAFQGNAKWEGSDQKVSFLFICCFMTPFILIGIGGLLALFIRGSRSAVLNVAESTLEALESGFFGTRLHQWQAKGLITIGILREKHDDGEEGINWTVSLGIQAKDGSISRLLSNRDQAELEWIATLLRQTLHLANIELTTTNC
jgi:hypothetical protein